MIIKKGIIYLISSIINAAFPFLLLPLLTNRLSVFEYGILASYQISVAIIYPIISLHLESIIQKKYYDASRIELSKYISSSMIVAIVICIISLLLVAISYELGIIDNKEFTLIYLLSIPILALMQFSINIYLLLMQSSGLAIQYSIFSVASGAINMGMTYLLFTYVGQSAYIRIDAILITATIFFILSVYMINKNIKIFIRPTILHIKKSIKFSSPLVTHTFAGMIMIFSDRYILEKKGYYESLGIFTLGLQFATIIAIISNAFNNSYSSWLYENLAKKNKDLYKYFIRIFYYLMIFLIAVSLLIYIFFQTSLGIYINIRYAEASNILPLLLLGFIGQSAYFMVTNFLIYDEKTKIQSTITTTLGIIKILASCMLIQLYGIYGAAISFALFLWFLFFMTAYANQVDRKISWILFTK